MAERIRYGVIITWRLFWDLVKAKVDGRMLWFEINVGAFRERGVLYTAHYIEGEVCGDVNHDWLVGHGAACPSCEEEEVHCRYCNDTGIAGQDGHACPHGCGGSDGD